MIPDGRGLETSERRSSESRVDCRGAVDPARQERTSLEKRLIDWADVEYVGAEMVEDPFRRLVSFDDGIDFTAMLEALSIEIRSADDGERIVEDGELRVHHSAGILEDAHPAAQESRYELAYGSSQDWMIRLAGEQEFDAYASIAGVCQGIQHFQAGCEIGTDEEHV